MLVSLPHHSSFQFKNVQISFFNILFRFLIIQAHFVVLFKMQFTASLSAALALFFGLATAAPQATTPTPTTPIYTPTPTPSNVNILPACVV